jgi:hypothetical protein
MAFPSIGAGDVLAGLGPAGHDPEVVTPTDLAGRAPILAPRFDPYDRVYVIDETSQALSDQDPIIHRAAHLLGLRRGSLPSAPTVGLDTARIRKAVPAARQRACEDASAEALAVLVDASDIAIEGVVLSSPWTGEFFVDVRPLRTPTGKPVRVRATTE